MRNGTRASGGVGGCSQHALTVVVVLLVVAVLTVTPVSAGILNVSWVAPETKDDGSTLTDLFGYRVYYGTTGAPCPGGSSLMVRAPQSSPDSNETVTAALVDVTPGVLYFTSITAVNVAGDESVCSDVVSAVAHTDVSLTVVKTGSGSGSVHTTPSRIDCGLTCSAVFATGASVTLTATADAGSVFTGWSGGCSGVEPCHVTPSGATVITATFTLGAPTLVAPSGSIATSSPTYTWNAVMGATQYLLWVDDSSGGRIRTWYTAAQAGCEWEAVTCSLTPGTSLSPGAGRWFIVAANAFGNSPWSSAMPFTVPGPTLPGVASLLSPSGAIVTASPTYTWEAVAGATQYLLWVDDSSGGRIRAWSTAAQAGCDSGAGTCSLTPTVVLNPGTGRWFIVAANASGNGPWSSAMPFSVSGVSLTAPTLLSPSGSIGTPSPTYTWNAVMGATQYLLWVDDSSGGRIRAWFTAAQAGCDSGIGTCSLTPATVLKAGAGQWFIVAANATGNGPWSDAMHFTMAVTSPPAAATLLSPSGTIATANPVYTWNAVPTATLYLLWVDDGSGGRIRAWYTAAQAGCDSGTGTCSLLPGVILNPGVGRWFIVAANAFGNAPWSSAMAFTVPGSPLPSAATLLSPSGIILTANPTYTWNAVADATQYLLWVDDSTGGRIRTWYTATQAGCDSGTGTCSLTPGVVLNPGAGRWFIVAANASGSGPWSSASLFIVP